MALFDEMVLLHTDDEDDGYAYYAIREDKKIPVETVQNSVSSLKLPVNYIIQSTIKINIQLIQR